MDNPHESDPHPWPPTQSHVGATTATAMAALSADDAELLAIRSRFCGLVARWRLTQGELGCLLGLETDDWTKTGRVLPDRLDSRGEKAMRLLVRADHGLEAMMPEPGAVAQWLREPAPAYDGAMPLIAMCDMANLRAIVLVLEGRLPETR